MIRIDVLGDYSHVDYPLVLQKAAQVRPVHTMRLNLVNSVVVPKSQRARGRILGIPVQGRSLFEILRGKS
jgi:hypothetical protein